jgi:hypothetical protein
MSREEILARVEGSKHAKMLRDVYHGHPFPEGERDTSGHLSVSTIVWTVPEADMASVQAYLAPTIKAMAEAAPNDPGFTEERVTFSYERARGALVAQRQSQAEVETRLRAHLAGLVGVGLDGAPIPDPVQDVLLRLAEAAAEPQDHDLVPDPDGPKEVGPAPESVLYGHDELERLAEMAGCAVDDLPRRWIIQRGTSFYVLGAEGYKPPIASQELPASLPRDLARAPINLFTISKEGVWKPRPSTEILAEYATVARHSVASMVAQASTYDARTETFVESVAPLRPLVPRYHPEIHTWLQLLGGERAEKLLDWVATVTWLDRPTCCLYLVGPGGAGKTMLAHGLARLWSIGAPTMASQVLSGSFNSALAKCPLILADEALPRRVGSKSTSAELRELIGTTARPLTRKYLSDSDLVGAIRLVLAANNDRLLDFREELDSWDQSALAERFWILHVPEEASAYLASLGGRSGTTDWVDGDRIAAHALWLRDTRSIHPEGRWIVRGEVADVHERLAVSSGVSGLVTEWIARYIANPGLAPKREVPGILVGDGEILANPSYIADSWEVYVRSDRTPSTTAIGRALRTLSVSGDRVHRDVGGKRVWFWSVRVPTLLRWVADNLVGDPGAVQARVAAPVLVSVPGTGRVGAA